MKYKLGENSFEIHWSGDIPTGIPSCYGYLEGCLLTLLIYKREFFINV